MPDLSTAVDLETISRDLTKQLSHYADTITESIYEDRTPNIFEIVELFLKQLNSLWSMRVKYHL